MAKWYHKGNTDKNQKDIVAELRKIPGVRVNLGHDDILVGYKGLNYWYGIKNPDQIKKDGTAKGNSRTRQKQDKLLETWSGHIKLVWSLDQILEDIGVNS